MTAITYKSILEGAFSQFGELFGGQRWTFQQDNAPIHTAETTKAWIQTGQKVNLLPWQPYSPDLNIMESVWGWFLRKVYEAIKRSWVQISINYLTALYEYIHHRLLEVIQESGGSTHY